MAEEKNPYERQGDTLDIPDFNYDKSNTQSSSIDMSIFKMNEEELYDDVVVEEDVVEQEVEPEAIVEKKTTKKRKTNKTILFCLILIGLLMITTLASLLYAFKQKNAYSKVNASYNQLLAAKDAFEKEKEEQNQIIADLKKQIEDLSKSTIASEGIYEVIDGPISFRTAPSRDGDFTTYNGLSEASNGEQYKAIEVVRGEDDPDYTWIKVADNIYFCLGTSDDMWAKKVD